MVVDFEYCLVCEKMPVQSCQNLTGRMLYQYTVVNEYICTAFVIIGTVHMKTAPRVYIYIYAIGVNCLI